MTAVISNVVAPALVIAGYSLLLTAIGFGPTARLLSRDNPPMSILIAPVIGISLLAITHYVLLLYAVLPHQPLLVNLGLLLLSLVSCLTIADGCVRWHAGVRGLRPALAQAWPYAIVPVGFCTLFMRSGVEMLSAGQDEFAYAGVAEQIMRHMHQGTALDLPVPRADHLVTDLVPVDLTYRADQRLGVSYQLADLAWFSGISPEQAFPLLVGVFIATTTLALGSLEWMLFSGSRAGVLAAQRDLAAAIFGAVTNNLFAVRGIQFNTSLMLLGLTCFAFASGTRPASLLGTGALYGTRMAVAVLTAGLLALNAFTQYRVLRHVNGHTIETDPIIHRFNPEAPVWRRLREAVSTPGDTPVLISGFRDTHHTGLLSAFDRRRIS